MLLRRRDAILILKEIKFVTYTTFIIECAWLEILGLEEALGTGRSHWNLSGWEVRPQNEGRRAISPDSTSTPKCQDHQSTLSGQLLFEKPSPSGEHDFYRNLLAMQSK